MLAGDEADTSKMGNSSTPAVVMPKTIACTEEPEGHAHRKRLAKLNYFVEVHKRGSPCTQTKSGATKQKSKTQGRVLNMRLDFNILYMISFQEGRFEAADQTHLLSS